jgi:hypothetical protein
MHGTPFDDRINGVFKTWRTQQQDTRMPFVTMLRAYKGKLTDCSVNPAPWVVELPPLPPEVQTAKTAPKPAVAPPKPTPAPTLPPLIISGKKPQQQAAAQSADTNLTTTVPATQLATPDNAQPQASSGAASPSSATAPQNNSVPQTQTAGTQAPIPVTTPSTGPDSAKPVAVDAHNTEVVQTKAQPSRPGIGRVETQGVDAKSISNAMRETPHELQPALPSASTAAQTEFATTPANGSILASPMLWIGAVLGTLVVVGGIWFWRSRSRPAAPSSLITQSFDRDTK